MTSKLHLHKTIPNHPILKYQTYLRQIMTNINHQTSSTSRWVQLTQNLRNKTKKIKIELFETNFNHLILNLFINNLRLTKNDPLVYSFDCWILTKIISQNFLQKFTLNKLTIFYHRTKIVGTSRLIETKAKLIQIRRKKGS